MKILVQKDGAFTEALKIGVNFKINMTGRDNGYILVRGGLGTCKSSQMGICFPRRSRRKDEGPPVLGYFYPSMR